MKNKNKRSGQIIILKYELSHNKITNCHIASKQERSTYCEGSVDNLKKKKKHGKKRTNKSNKNKTIDKPSQNAVNVEI